MEKSVRRTEIQDKLNENEIRLLELEQKIEMLKQENLKLREYLEEGKNSIKILSDELYEYIGKQDKQIIQHIDNTEVDLGNRIQVLSDGIYDHVGQQLRMRDNTLEEYKNQEWFTKFGFDNMISELQLNAVEQVVPGNRKRLEALKDTHMGEICFVIGNGPSLKARDLDKLKEKGIFCFASKGIYNIFEETQWRPDIWGVSDLDYIAIKKDKLNELDGFIKLVCAQSLIKCGIEISNSIYYPFIQAERKPKFFNKDVTRGVHFYGTITAKLINFAVYMGFKKIYLLGCDHTLPIKTDEHGKKVVDTSKNMHFGSNYYDSKEEQQKAYMNIENAESAQQYVTDSYKDIKYFCDQLSVEIYNATRGGELEVFPRVNFDEI